jgi:hypothetical protein
MLFEPGGQRVGVRSEGAGSPDGDFRPPGRERGEDFRGANVDAGGVGVEDPRCGVELAGLPGRGVGEWASGPGETSATAFSDG